ncbi:MAG: hypothetical protein M3R55_16200 [Acidobacteriota bacterium]|nr:hypothetical protein [Acidobacteriota bacterium]
MPFALSPPPPEHLSAVRALPPEIGGRFRELANLQQASDSSYFAFDKRSHSVHRIDARWTASRLVVDIGTERGQLLQPSAFDLGPDDLFVISDAPFGVDRIQLFYTDGTALGAFQPQIRSLPRVTMGATVLNGAGSLEYTRDAVLLSEPDTGWLVTEYATDGKARRHIGHLRATGHEKDPDAHIALNTGIPVAAADGGLWFVFQAGVPMLRRYGPDGTLLFERHIEGVELDPVIRALPSTWPRRGAGTARELPLIVPNVQAAAAAPDGSLWIALSLPYVVVFDESGDKRRTVQLHGAGVIRPASLAFSRGGRLIVTPGGYEFDVAVPAKNRAAPGMTR